MERDAAEIRFELLARIAPVGLFRTTADGHCIYVNPRWCEITGLRPDQARGTGWAATLHPEDRQRVFDEWYRAAAAGDEFQSEYRFAHPDGSVRWVVGRGAAEISDGVIVGYIGTVTDVTERKQAEIERERVFEQEHVARAEAERLNVAIQELFEERSRLAAIVDDSDDAIVSKTVDGVIRTWNRGAERMFGWTAEEAIGRHITLIIPEERHAEEGDVLARIRRGESVRHFETVRLTKDRRRLNISLTVSPVKDAAGQIVGASKIARDTSERRRLEDQRERLLIQERQAREEAEASSRTKEQLLAVVSHELRTPLNSILGYARILQTGDLNESARPHAVDVMVRSASSLTHLVDDLLDMSRIVRGRLALALEACEISTLIADAVDAVRPAAEAKGVALATEVSADAGKIVCDPDRIRQVIWNLIMNAIKFTPGDGRINVAVTHTDQQVRVVIRDNGVGISPDVLPHVFETFRQEDSSTTRLHGGLGLGLALVKSVVELHGGRVVAESLGKGHGSTFTVTLPRDNKPASGDEQIVVPRTSA